ncbi:FRAS1-related extracellular matrix protein 1-like [Aplochiton taeniatus]
MTQSLVKTNKGLKVKIGQAAYLEEGDLEFHITHRRNACKIEVVLNEPITQRVGRVTPQVFDCNYLADEVKYVHNGCPILREDTVKLRLYRFTQTETYMEVFSLHVEIMEPDCNIIKLGPKSLEVPDIYGMSNILDGNVLSFHYERRSSLECTVHFSNSLLPVHGKLIAGQLDQLIPNGDKAASFNSLHQQQDTAVYKRTVFLNGHNLEKVTAFQCDDFLVMGLRYKHIDPPSPDIDYIAFRLDLKDTRSGRVHQSEHAWIPVRIVGAMPNQPPKPSFMSMFILEVDQFILTPLSTAILDAEDEENPKQHLVFNITKQPTDGFMTHLSDHTRQISSFSWADLNDMLIGYQPSNSSHHRRRNYKVEFEAHDLYFEKSVTMLVHISVRTSDTNAPRVSWNMGLSLLEGQSRLITWEQLQIVDNDNLPDVRVIMVDGLQHGKLTISGETGFMFTVDDIRTGAVCYHHDDSDNTKDFIIFRITDGHHQSRHKFPISILPKDDSPPFLITNVLLKLCEGQAALLSSSTLQASDIGSSVDYILFNITRPPQAGQIMKIPGHGLTGYPVSHFLQKDLFGFVVHYQHQGHEVFDDSFEVVLSDSHDPPNLSEPQVIYVHIEPVPDQPPKEVPGMSRCLVVRETEIIPLTKNQLHYVDQESPESELKYTVTTPPFYNSSYRSADAGRLFLVDSIPKLTKNSSAPALRSFTQYAVNFMKVAYMPPIMDIGPYPRHIQFILSITNQQGKTLTGISFNITVLPVDNQAPEVLTNPLTVEEGSGCRIGPEHLVLTDLDSMEEALRLELRRKPKHGLVQREGLPLKAGYQHDGSETVEDSIEFTATDGKNSADFDMQVKVIPVNNKAPVVVPGLKQGLSVAEGEEVVITAEYIYSTDEDSDNNSLSYFIARQPYYGVVCKRGNVVDRLIQEDIMKGIVTYKHTGTEIGVTPRNDTITFVISDGEAENTPGCFDTNLYENKDSWLLHTLPVYDLKVHVYPVDNQPPSLLMGDVFVVEEGGTSPISSAHLTAFDEDTALGELVINIVSSSEYGFIENVVPSPGFEKSNMGVSIASFSYKDILNGHVNYVQSIHQGSEPTLDQIILSVTDGKQNSTSVPFYIIINPTNDEIPQVETSNLTVLEGGLDMIVIRAVDLDVPKNELLFSVTQDPKHGRILRGNFEKERKNSGKPASLHPSTEVMVQDFTWEELNSGMSLMYMHDDSENMKDSFTIQLTDGKHQLRRQVNVTVLPLNDERPEVGIEWINLKSGENFTQEAVNMNLLRYLHTSASETKIQDVFVFNLWDGKNRSPAHNFHISVKERNKGTMLITQLCPQGWTFHGEHCYLLIGENKVTWSAAIKACREKYQGILASISSKDDMEWLWKFSGRKPFWIGLNDRESQGQWEWVSKEAVIYTNWGRNPPRSKTNGIKKCVLVWKRAKWQIRDCKKGRGHQYVCSIKISN